MPHPRRAPAALVAAVFLLFGCSDDSGSDAQVDGGDAASVVDGTDSASEEGSVPREEPDALLVDLAVAVESSGFACSDPVLNEEPDASNQYSASMSCATEAGPEFTIYTGEPEPFSGVECSESDTPFSEDMDVWEAYLMTDDFYVDLEVLPAEIGSAAEVVSTLQEFATAAGWGVVPTCAGPV